MIFNFTITPASVKQLGRIWIKTEYESAINLWYYKNKIKTQQSPMHIYRIFCIWRCTTQQLRAMCYVLCLLCTILLLSVACRMHIILCCNIHVYGLVYPYICYQHGKCKITSVAMNWSWVSHAMSKYIFNWHTWNSAKLESAFILISFNLKYKNRKLTVLIRLTTIMVNSTLLISTL